MPTDDLRAAVHQKVKDDQEALLRAARRKAAEAAANREAAEKAREEHAAQEARELAAEQEARDKAAREEHEEKERLIAELLVLSDADNQIAADARADMEAERRTQRPSATVDSAR